MGPLRGHYGPFSRVIHGHFLGQWRSEKSCIYKACTTRLPHKGQCGSGRGQVRVGQHGSALGQARSARVSAGQGMARSGWVSTRSGWVSMGQHGVSVGQAFPGPKVSGALVGPEARIRRVQ
jgi:hypothetical protein